MDMRMALYTRGAAAFRLNSVPATCECVGKPSGDNLPRNPPGPCGSSDTISKEGRRIRCAPLHVQNEEAAFEVAIVHSQLFLLSGSIVVALKEEFRFVLGCVIGGSTRRI